MHGRTRTRAKWHDDISPVTNNFVIIIQLLCFVMLYWCFLSSMFTLFVSYFCCFPVFLWYNLVKWIFWRKQKWIFPFPGSMSVLLCSTHIFMFQEMFLFMKGMATCIHIEYFTKLNCLKFTSKKRDYAAKERDMSWQMENETCAAENM